MSYLIEIAVSDFQTAEAAITGGADRIELCANLHEGGTTPSLGVIKKCRERFDIPIYPIIRPRGGDFLYSAEEFAIMCTDVMKCKELGCDGVVLGLLKKDGHLDLQRTSRLLSLAYPMPVTFHRAFDRCIDPFVALEELVQIGVERILTSGQQLTVNEGADLIAALNKVADHRIIIMPGSGVKESNIKWLADKTGCREFHASLRDKEKTKMDFIHPSFSNQEEYYLNNMIDPVAVQSLRKALS
ncbi:MAG: copper homeostasis protein CutC [Terrimonas sp.]|nr:copper homeostasis protein CutC [Terrimonas sp.]